MKITLQLKGWRLTENQRKRLKGIDGEIVNIRYTNGFSSGMDFDIPRDEIISSLEMELIKVNGGSLSVEIYY